MANVVTVNLDLDELIEELEDAALEAIVDGAKFSEKELKKRIPPNRKKTRDAVFSRTEGDHADVGVKFPPGRRYPKRGTETERIVKRAWREIKEPVIHHIEQSFHSRVEELSR